MVSQRRMELLSGQFDPFHQLLQLGFLLEYLFPVITDKRIDDIVVNFTCKRNCSNDGLIAHLHHSGVLCGCHFNSLSFPLFLPAFFPHIDIGAISEEKRQSYQPDNGPDPAVIDRQREEEGRREGAEGGEKPATNDRNYPVDPVNGRFSSPCTVGHGGGHGHHKSYVSC